ncbi:hypothetical protein UFOVP469_16 [uncultured Caudovirales phage]|uniref:Uncharacterized protein n=1 Tax=uncultured Caudovirales phage TaxID=2100421 RepID=A0A6J5R974_9CAUD|nr:hypothetical protein UFOVP469_16 [uncultured Caudovirales phage]CAB4190228.1 hypothetical protein UFOVP1200_46 [uncultured Caudovirales phage]
MSDAERMGGNVHLMRWFGASHRVPPPIVQARLREDLDETVEGAWWSFVIYDDGRAALVPQSPFAPRPPLSAEARMMEIGVMLNRELHHNGHWVVAWADGQINILWRDGDGDLQFVDTFDETWARIRRWPATTFVQSAERAWQRWRDHTLTAELKRGEMYRRALGERPLAVVRRS